MAVISNPSSFFINGTIISGWILFMTQLTWNQSETFYMQIKRILFFINNPDCTWNMMVEFSLNFDQDIFNKIDELFERKYSNIRIISLSNQRKIYKLDTIAIEVITDYSDNKVMFHIDNLEVSYRRSRNIIDHELGELFEKLSKCLKEDQSEYYFNVDFKEFNPYYGFFIRRLNATEINSFNVKFNIENDKVTIGKNSIEIYTTSLQKLNTLSKEYLSLSPR